MFTAHVFAIVTVWLCQGQVLMASRQGGVTLREVRQALLSVHSSAEACCLQDPMCVFLLTSVLRCSVRRSDPSIPLE